LELVAGSGSDNQKLVKLFLTALGRHPTRAELSGLQRVMAVSRDKRYAYQDVFWALLNSNEFILIH
jgi:hypothetical protein